MSENPLWRYTSLFDSTRHASYHDLCSALDDLQELSELINERIEESITFIPNEGLNRSYLMPDTEREKLYEVLDDLKEKVDGTLKKIRVKEIYIYNYEGDEPLEVEVKSLSYTPMKVDGEQCRRR